MRDCTLGHHGLDAFAEDVFGLLRPDAARARGAVAVVAAQATPPPGAMRRLSYPGI